MRYANELRVSPRVKSLAEDIAKQASKKGTLQGKKPATIAGAALLIAIEDSMDISSAASIISKLPTSVGKQESTLRERAKQIRNDGIDAEYIKKIREEELKQTRN